MAFVALVAVCLAGCSPVLAENADEVLEQPAMPVPLADGKCLVPNCLDPASLCLNDFLTLIFI